MTLRWTGEDLNNQLPPLGKLLGDYYLHRGWSEKGIPAPEKFKLNYLPAEGTPILGTNHKGVIPNWDNPLNIVVFI